MKYTKAAAVVAGSVMAMGVASPAFADDVDNAPGAPKQAEKQLLDSDTKTKQDVKNPLGDLNIKAFVVALEKVAEKLKTDNTTNAKTKVGDAPKAAGAPGPAQMIGGLPAGVPLG